MQRKNVLMVTGLVIVGLQLPACRQHSATKPTEHPALVERLEGSDLSHVTLTEEAIGRIDLQTDRVREQRVTRKLMVGGIVLPAFADGRSSVWVRVRLSEGDLKRVARSQPAYVLALAPGDDDGDDDGERAGLTARLLEDDDDTKKATPGLYYVVDGAEPDLAPGQQVRLRLPLSGNETKRRVVPYSALIYDRDGQTWVYTSPTPRTFVRHKVEVDHIDGDVAVLNDGPPADTVVASVGVAELYGTEFKVGH